MRKPGNIFLLAIIIGALSAAMVYRHLSSLHQEVQIAKSSSDHPTTDVVVASDEIPIGTKIDADHVKVVAWPADIQPEGVLHDPNKVVGTIARTSITKNEPVMQTQIVSDAMGILPMMIPAGMRGMSVKVDNVTGVSGFITPNSRVDVLIAAKPDGDQDAEILSKVVLQNVKVLATGTIIEQKDNKPVEVPTVTLLVSPEDAEKLTLATKYDAVRLALRNYRDEDHIHTAGVTSHGMFDVARRTIDNAAEVPSLGTGPTVEIVLGDKITRQPML
jgi:pilus assembly protein CpaB